MTDTGTLAPHLDVEGLRCFKDLVKGTRCYLEYGCGGSTVYAARTLGASTVISVESDKAWIEKVRSALGDAGSRVRLEYCDLGEVGEWGFPKSREKMHNYWSYSSAPWQAARSMNAVPTVVLVDGRFRVASFLTSLISARIGTPILFDDYFDRPAYFVVERFCSLEQQHGRMALFVVGKNHSIPEVCSVIAQYSVLPD